MRAHSWLELVAIDFSQILDYWKRQKQGKSAYSEVGTNNIIVCSHCKQISPAFVFSLHAAFMIAAAH